MMILCANLTTLEMMALIFLWCHDPLGSSKKKGLVYKYISYLQQELHAPSSRPNGKNNRGDDPMPDWDQSEEINDRRSD